MRFMPETFAYIYELKTVNAEKTKKMKTKKILPGLLLTLLFFMGFYFTACERYTQRQIIISSVKKEDSQHLGNGVWMVIPDSYKKANSYNGFQAITRQSSISLDMNRKSIDEVKKAYAPGHLKEVNMALLELSTVHYGGNENGVFLVIHDKSKKVIRYLLSIAINDRTYNIKAFCLERRKDRYDPEIRKSLESIYIGDYKEKEKLFKLAKLESLTELFFTKDGVYPTNSPDNAVIKTKKMTSFEGILESGLIKSELQKITGKNSNSWGVETLSNGKFFFGTSESENKKGFVALLVNQKQEALLVSCSGNQNSSLIEFERYVRETLIKTSI